MSATTTTPSGKHSVDQVLPFGQMFVYGLQHVLSMYAGVVAVPLIVGSALELSGPEARRPATPPSAVPIARIVDTAANEVPCTIGCRAPNFHTPRVCKSVASPEISRPADTRSLAHHPRIGQRAEGGSAEAALSRSEQASLTVDDDGQRRLRAGNEAYAERFGRVFLIRAAGRSAEEILAALESRLTNDEETEQAIVADQPRQIALLRLAQAVSA